MGFYNDGNSSHVKQYLDYFLNSSNPSNTNLNSFEEKDKIVNPNSSSNKKRKNDDKKIISSCPISPNQGHGYKLTITFKESIK